MLYDSNIKLGFGKCVYKKGNIQKTWVPTTDQLVLASFCQTRPNDVSDSRAAISAYC